MKHWWNFERVKWSHWSEWVRRRRCTNKLWRSVRFTATRSEFRDSTEWKIWLNTGLDGDDDDVSVSISKVYVLSCPVHRKHLAAINRHLSFPLGAFKSGEESKRASRYQRVISIDREGEGERELLFVDLYSLNFTSLTIAFIERLLLNWENIWTKAQSFSPSHSLSRCSTWWWSYEIQFKVLVI